jgi:hypothetical protein
MPEDITYEEIFENVKEAVTNLLSDKTEATALCTIVERSKYGIRNELCTAENLVKGTYMKRKEDLRLDRHKRGACVIVAFMKKLIVEEDNARFEIYREKLAILAGLSVMGTLLLGERQNNSEKEMSFKEHLKNKRCFDLPDTLCDEVGSYEDCWRLELREAYKVDRALAQMEKPQKEALLLQSIKCGFSILSIANELFLIESYNREKANGRNKA